MNFEWPAFIREKDRIAHFSRLYKNRSIVDAFNHHYKMSLDAVEIETPRDYVAGDTIKLNVVKIRGGEAIVESKSLKTPIRVRDNFSKCHLSTPFEVEGRVISVKKDLIVVDVMNHQTQTMLPTVLKSLEDQRKIEGYKSYTVNNLKLTRGGFLGDLVIPELGIIEGYTVPAFIPGSQIVLNKTDNFNQHIGTSVQVHISSVSPWGNVICSAKEYLQHLGNLNLINIHKMWCDDGEPWKSFSSVPRRGRVTGTVNSNHKKGVYVEIPELYLTAMIPMDDPSGYKAGDECFVRIADIQEQIVYDEYTKQRRHIDPYIIIDDVLDEISIKPVFVFS